MAKFICDKCGDGPCYLVFEETPGSNLPFVCPWQQTVKASWKQIKEDI